MNIIESPRILVTALVDDEKCLDTLKDKLESEVVKVVRQVRTVCSVVLCEHLGSVYGYFYQDIRNIVNPSWNNYNNL